LNLSSTTVGTDYETCIVLGAAAALLLAAFTVNAADQPKIPAVGDKAPLVEGKDHNGKTWKLADLSGKKNVLLYFYPKDETPLHQGSLRSPRPHGGLKKDNVAVVGVSFDSAESHKQFIARNNLNFALLADTDGKIADTFGVRRAGGNVARRVSFLIGKDGKITHVTDNSNADVHLTEMKEAWPG